MGRVLQVPNNSEVSSSCHVSSPLKGGYGVCRRHTTRPKARPPGSNFLPVSTLCPRLKEKGLVLSCVLFSRA